MKTPTRNAVLALVAALAALLAAACGGRGEDDAPPPDQQTQPINPMCAERPERCR